MTSSNFCSGCQYSDGEIDDRVHDEWLIKKENMQYEKDLCNARERNQKVITAVSIRDKLSTIKEMINVCAFALGNSEWQGQPKLCNSVSFLLLCSVCDEIEQIDEDLKKL